jgi:phosphohistidine phosphatase
MKEKILKTILLMRHAKSAWAEPDTKDFDRPLNKRGEEDAPGMGQYLIRAGIQSPYVVSSTALRARQTALAVANQFGLIESGITWNKDLYYGGHESYLKTIQAAPETAQTVLVVGHNPMTEATMALLADHVFLERVVTASVACFRSDAASWNEIDSGSCRLDWFVTPEQIK